MKLSTLFSSLGLSKLESDIYFVLLRLNRASISTIAGEVQTYRPTVYRTLPKLISKGLVSQVKSGKRTVYIAEDPKKLKELADNIQYELGETLPELSRVYDGSQKRPFVRYVEGKKAIESIYEDMVRRSKKGDSIYRYESPRDYHLLGKYYPKLYWKRATGPDGEIEKHVITNEATASKRSERLSRHTRVIPSAYDSFDYNITELIYKDTVAFIDYDTETAMLVKNKRFSEFQLKIFKMLFGKLGSK